MLTSRLGRLIAPCFSTVVLATLAISTAVVHAQVAGPPAPDSIIYKVQDASERLEMTVNTSRILTLDDKIPRFVVNDPDKVKVTPVSATQLQIVALKPGVTQINLWTDKGKIHSIDVIVFGDARELAMVLETEFPNASLKVRPLSQNVIISGFVDRPDYVSRIHRIAEEYYPNVIDNITVGGVQQVQLHCKVMEVSRTKLRRMGFDFASLSNGDYLFSSVSGLLSTGTATFAGSGGETMQFGVVGNNSSFFGYLDLLRQYDLAKVFAEPTLTTVSGRPAFFESGGQFPVPSGRDRDGNVTIVWKSFGTRLDFVPIVLGNGNIRLEVRPRISETDNARSVVIGNTTVPGIRIRECDCGVELRAGQTLVLAGLLQHRVESIDKGIPWLSDLPWFGAAFRSKQEKINEIELIIMVTPELVDGMESEQVPPGGPGMNTTSPCDVDFYFRGYMEVPNPNVGSAYDEGQEYEILPPQQSPGEVPSEPSEGDDPPLPEAGSDAAHEAAPAASLAERLPQYDRYDQSSRYQQRQRQRYEQPSSAGSSQNTPGLFGPIGYDKVD